MVYNLYHFCVKMNSQPYTQLLTNQWSFEWILSSYRNCLRWTYIQFKLTQYQVGMSNQIWFLFLWLLIVLVKGSINFLSFCILFLAVRDLKIQKIDISVVTMYRLILVQCRLVIRIVDMSSLIFICHEAKKVNGL